MQPSTVLPTEWYPPDVPPARFGLYECLEVTKLPEEDPTPTMADWCVKFGQLGFWRETCGLKRGGWAPASLSNDAEPMTHNWRLLTISQWRGRKPTPRVPLISQRQLNLSLKVSSIRRVLLNAKS